MGLFFVGLACASGLATGRLDRPGRALVGICSAVAAAIIVAVQSHGLVVGFDVLGWALSAFQMILAVLFALMAINPDVLRHRWLRRLVSDPFKREWEAAQQVGALRPNFAGHTPGHGTSGLT